MTKGLIATTTALVALLVAVATQTWDVKATIAQEAADAGAAAGEAAAKVAIEPIAKTLEQIQSQGREAEVRDELVFCLEYKHRELEPDPRLHRCGIESEAFRDWLICDESERTDCGIDPRREK